MKRPRCFLRHLQHRVWDTSVLQKVEFVRSMNLGCFCSSYLAYLGSHNTAGHEIYTTGYMASSHYVDLIITPNLPNTSQISRQTKQMSSPSTWAFEVTAWCEIERPSCISSPSSHVKSTHLVSLKSLLNFCLLWVLLQLWPDSLATFVQLISFVR